MAKRKPEELCSSFLSALKKAEDKASNLMGTLSRVPDMGAVENMIADDTRKAIHEWIDEIRDSIPK